MAPGDTARLYHELTSYAPDREWDVPVDHPLVRQDFEPNDLSTFPAPHKAYANGLPRVALPREWPAPGVSATAALAGLVPSSGALDLDALARILFLSAGVVRVTERPDGRRYLMRAAGSAGGRFPLELYVSARGVPGLADGVHWYHPADHALVLVGPPAGGDATTVIATGVPWYTGWRYAERGFRHIYWDGGTMLSQTLVLAETAGLHPRLYTRFPDAEVSRLVAADGTHEFPIWLVALEDGEPAIRPGGDAKTGTVDRAPVEFPLVTRAQHAGDQDALGDPWPDHPPLAAAPESPELDDVLLTRGSTRTFDPGASIPRAAFEFALTASLRVTRLPHYVAVHGVDGVAPGLYRWPGLVRAGDLREELFVLSLEQELPRDAAFVVIAAADVAPFDDRGYREAQLGAGRVEGRLHIAAYALGLGATGMTFYDSMIPDTLGTPLAGLLLTCVGVPTYRNRRGGRPGAPVQIS